MWSYLNDILLTPNPTQNSLIHLPSAPFLIPQLINNRLIEA